MIQPSTFHSWINNIDENLYQYYVAVKLDGMSTSELVSIHSQIMCKGRC